MPLVGDKPPIRVGQLPTDGHGRQTEHSMRQTCREIIVYVASAALLVAIMVWFTPSGAVRSNGAVETPAVLPLDQASEPNSAVQRLVNRDPQVHPVSNLVPLVAVPTHAVGQVGTDVLRVVSVTQSGKTWIPNGEPIVLLDRKTVAIRCTTNPSKQPTAATPATIVADGNFWVVSFQPTGTGTRQTVDISVDSQTVPVELDVPAQTTAPSILSYTNQSLGSPVSPIATSNSVYGQFVKLRGNAHPGTKLTFVVFDHQAGSYLGEAEGGAEAGTDGVWEAELKLPKRATTFQGAIYARSLSANGQFVVSSSPFVYEVQPSEKILEGAPSDLAAVSPYRTLASGAATYKTPVFNVTGKVKGTAAELRDCRINLYNADTGGNVGGPAIVNPTDGIWTATANVKRAGNFKIVAKSILGNSESDASLPIVVRVGSQNPKVDKVDPTNLAFSPAHKTIVVRFDKTAEIDFEPLPAALDGSTTSYALRASSYTLRNSKKESIPLEEKIAPNRGDNSVTLVATKEIPPEVYNLEVSEKIRDIYGNEMGELTVERLFMPVESETPSVIPGIPGPTGPYVPFPEFTKPRPPTNGFNPSDHVESRVSRLYYYRDAHRVAQIVNRNVKSYNRAAVDMQRQLADKSPKLPIKQPRPGKKQSVRPSRRLARHAK